MKENLITEDNHFKYLVVCYALENGQIIHRYSAKTPQEAEAFVDLIKGQGDVIIQQMDHWVVIP